MSQKNEQNPVPDKLRLVRYHRSPSLPQIQIWNKRISSVEKTIGHNDENGKDPHKFDQQS